MITTTLKIVLALMKDFSATHTATSLAHQLAMSRWGVWKTIRRLHHEEILTLKSMGAGKTSTQTIHINWNNPLTDKTLTLALAQEAAAYKRWCFNFADIEPKVDFFLLYGSIIHSPQTAGDIDVLSVAKERKLTIVNKCLFTIQKTQEKKIHSHNFTAREFIQELKKPNKVFIDALKKGVVLFGQARFVEFMKRLLS